MSSRFFKAEMLLKNCLSTNDENKNCDIGALKAASKNTCPVSELIYTDD